MVLGERTGVSWDMVERPPVTTSTLGTSSMSHPDVPAQNRALTWACCRASQKMATEPRCPSSEVGLPHSMSWLPAAVVATTPSVGSWVGVQEWGPRVAGTDWERASTGCWGKTSSGPWDAGAWLAVAAAVVVVR